MNKNTRRQLIRWIILAASIIFTVFLSAFISVHAICPIGGFELFFTGLFSSGFSIAGFFSGMVIIFLIMSVLSIVFRRSYCGYICPMGACQEFISIIGKKVLPAKLKNLKVPGAVNRILRWVKYAVLLSFVVGAFAVGGHWMLPADPFIALMSLGSRDGLASIFQRLPFAVIFFFAILVVSFFAGRLFCRYVCPAGAWYALLSKISLSRIVRNTDTCIHCGLCSKECPADLDVANLKVVNSGECIGCRQCERICPKDALSYKLGSAEIPSPVLPVTAAVVFAGSIMLSNMMIPARGEGNGQGYHGGGENRQGNGRQYKNGTGNAQGATMSTTGSQKKSRLAKAGGCGGNCASCGLCTGLLSALSTEL